MPTATNPITEMLKAAHTSLPAYLCFLEATRLNIPTSLASYMKVSYPAGPAALTWFMVLQAPQLWFHTRTSLEPFTFNIQNTVFPHVVSVETIFFLIWKSKGT